MAHCNKFSNCILFIFILCVPAKGYSNTLEDLRALPYIAWSESQANEKQKGVTRFNKAKAYDGYNLYADGLGYAYMMDMKGKILHHWKFPPGADEVIGGWEHFRLLENGDVIGVAVNHAAARIDKDSKLIWSTRAYTGHDIALLKDGSFLVPSKRARRYKNHRVVFDTIVHLSKDGNPLDTWSTFANLEDLHKEHLPSLLDEELPTYDDIGQEYYHLNTIEVLPNSALGQKDKRFQEGNWLLCFRNVDLIVILDKDTRKVVWSWGPGQVDGPHMPTLLDNGQLLIFDNGRRRKYSRLIMLDPLTKKIVWEYKAKAPETFFTENRGSSQLLPNGNFFICESDNGRAFEITPQGKIVWEFFNPILKEGKRKTIYRMIRIPKKSVSSWYQR
jgi:hypothetical protein